MYNKFSLPNPIDITALISMFECTYQKGYHYKGEIHDFWEINFVRKGTATICVDDDVFVLQQNDLLLVHPNKFHNFICGDSAVDVMIMSFELTGNITDKNTFTLGDHQKAQLLDIFNKGKEIFAFDDFVVRGMRSDDSVKIKSFKNDLELFLLEIASSAVAHAPQKQMSQKAILFSKIMQTLYTNLDKKLTLSEIADICCTSVSNLKSTFSYFTSDGIIGYFNKLKITKAQQLLLSGLNVKQVASALGFDEQNYFSTTFKKQTGMYPTHWLDTKKR